MAAPITCLVVNQVASTTVVLRVRHGVIHDNTHWPLNTREVSGRDNVGSWRFRGWPPACHAVHGPARPRHPLGSGRDPARLAIVNAALRVSIRVACANQTRSTVAQTRYAVWQLTRFLLTRVTERRQVQIRLPAWHRGCCRRTTSVGAMPCCDCQRHATGDDCCLCGVQRPAQVVYAATQRDRHWRPCRHSSFSAQPSAGGDRVMKRCIRAVSLYRSEVAARHFAGRGQHQQHGLVHGQSLDDRLLTVVYCRSMGTTRMELQRIEERAERAVRRKQVLPVCPRSLAYRAIVGLWHASRHAK
eukprot:3171533-Prymnesium_polylepis.1